MGAIGLDATLLQMGEASERRPLAGGEQADWSLTVRADAPPDHARGMCSSRGQRFTDPTPGMVTLSPGEWGMLTC